MVDIPSAADSIPSAHQSHSYGLFFFLLLPTLLLCLLAPIVLLRLSRLRLPPGPRALPLLGHLHLLGTNPHHSLCELSKRYGSLMYLRFGSVPVIVASSPAMARLVLQTHDQNFAWRSQNAVPMEVLGCRDVLFSQPGPFFKLMQQICTTDLFGSKRLEAFRPLIAEEVRALLRSIAETTEEVPIRTKLYEATCNVISRMMLSQRMQDLKDMVPLTLEVIRLIGVFNVGDFIPFLSRMDLQGYVSQSKVAGKKLRAVWQEIIDNRRNLRIARGTDDGSQDVDFLDVLLTVSQVRKDVEIEDFDIMAVLQDMFGAGIDTSTVTVEWVLAELLRHPQVMRKVQEELAQAVGMSRLVQESDIRHLDYLKAVVKETMRLHPVLPLLVPHMASQQCEVAGFDIPPKALAYVNVWAIGRDPSVWDAPLEFRPERFLDSNVDVRGQHFELLPFGSGRRSCPGITLGLGNVHLMLASLLHSFDWSTRSTMSEIDMSEKFGIVMTLAKPLVLKASLRTPRHLIEAQA